MSDIKEKISRANKLVAVGGLFTIFSLIVLKNPTLKLISALLGVVLALWGVIEGQKLRKK